MKTAISIPDDIFKDIDKLSRELHCPRSQILANAAKEYIEKLKNKKIFEALNKAYSEKETKQEVELRKKGKKHYAKLLNPKTAINHRGRNRLVPRHRETY